VIEEVVLIENETSNEIVVEEETTTAITEPKGEKTKTKR
jgi:hypothetical protein